MLKQRVQDDMKAALKSGEKRRLGTIRLLLAAIKQREVDERVELDDTQVLAVIDKMVKQRRDSLAQYQKAGREDLAEQEAFEIDQLKDYLPRALTEDEVNALIDAAISDTGAETIKDMGKVMGYVKPKAQGRADIGAISALVRSKLSN